MHVCVRSAPYAAAPLVLTVHPAAPPQLAAPRRRRRRPCARSRVVDGLDLLGGQRPVGCAVDQREGERLATRGHALAAVHVEEPHRLQQLAARRADRLLTRSAVTSSAHHERDVELDAGKRGTSGRAWRRRPRERAQRARARTRSPGASASNALEHARVHLAEPPHDLTAESTSAARPGCSCGSSAARTLRRSRPGRGTSDSMTPLPSKKSSGDGRLVPRADRATPRPARPRPPCAPWAACGPRRSGNRPIS